MLHMNGGSKQKKQISAVAEGSVEHRSDVLDFVSIEPEFASIGTNEIIIKLFLGIAVSNADIVRVAE